MSNANIEDTRKAPTKEQLFTAHLEALIEDHERTIANLNKAVASKPAKSGTYHDYATKETPGAIKQFMVWLNREFPAQFPTADDETQTRIVHLAIRTYVYYQKSDIKYATVKGKK